ncbi:MAG: helix-turn-helix transcriptional regulator [Mesorhizobium sp.]|uniref:TetR/AcrR family transcriptional regulator n=1 Tax=Mesorhizobium sp. TaxID=1871066 RepID=UPI00121165A0|nr:helix-turn-helix domain-containing protein [Mesorhizobium sp.]TIV81741.1 MAG: helix-turn-helix transcriptional regulator [Mesorhizobium sp.]TIW10849.1 MAG: helix-turn-helix transcriptional regulator [Mesorhizobium sp.]
MSNVRAYNSPLREEKARETREAILAALFELMDSASAADEISTEAIAQKAGVQRRTVFRHFTTKDDLLAAFWPWLNARIGVSATPKNLKEIVGGPRQAFPRFDTHEAAIRASLHSRTGREMRIGTVANRRANFARALAPAIASLPPAEAEKVESLAHLLFSASAWEVLKDYGGLTGTQAGETASWALEVILSAVTSGHSPADVASQMEISNED